MAQERLHDWRDGGTPTAGTSLLRDRPLGALAVASVLILFVVWSGLFISRTTVTLWDGTRTFCLFDDAMVSMRYAWNLAHGQGLVWNPGERVEGYSNLSQTLLMAAFILVLGKVKAVLAVQIAGIVTLVSAALFASKLAGRMSHESGVEVTAFWRATHLAVALGYYPLAYWSLMGMETGLLAMLWAGTAWFGLAAPRDRVSWPLVLVAGLATLTRPDAVVGVGLVLLVRLVASPRSRRTLAVTLAEAGMVIGVLCAVLAFRLLYYGSWVPNTYTLKITGYPLGFRMANGWAYVLPFLKTTAVPLAIAVAGLVLRPRRTAGVLVALFGSSVAYQVWVGGDAWTYWRFLAPTVPLLALAGLVQLRAILGARGAPAPAGDWVRASRWREDVVVLAVLGLSIWTLNAPFVSEISFVAPPFQVDGNQRAVNIGLALKETTTEAATVGVFRAGAIPYFAERRGVDFLGKSDPYIARLPPDLSGAAAAFGMKARPGHSKYDLRYSILTRRPTYLERAQWGGQDLAGLAGESYVRAFYKGVRLNLLKDSPDVRWHTLDAPEQRP